MRTQHSKGYQFAILNDLCIAIPPETLGLVSPQIFAMPISKNCGPVAWRVRLGLREECAGGGGTPSPDDHAEQAEQRYKQAAQQIPGPRGAGEARHLTGKDARSLRHRLGA